MEEIRAVFDWQPGEHAEVARILTGEARSGVRRVVRWAGGTIAVAMVAFVLFRLLMGDVQLAVATAPWLFFLVFWLWIFESMARRGQAARSLPPVDHRVDFPFVHIFSETGLRIETAGGATELYW